MCTSLTDFFAVFILLRGHLRRGNAEEKSCEDVARGTSSGQQRESTSVCFFLFTQLREIIFFDLAKGMRGTLQAEQ